MPRVWLVHAQSEALETTNAQQDGSEELTIVEVLSMRVSLASAQEIKQEKLEIVDSIVTDGDNNLPDFYITDAFFRVARIQILRDRSEAIGVAIRGLPQLESMLSGLTFNCR